MVQDLKKRRQGVIPFVIQKYYEERVEIKKEMLKLQQEYESKHQLNLYQIKYRICITNKWRLRF